MYIEDLDAVTNYTIEYRVTNNEGLEDVATFTVTTGELGNLLLWGIHKYVNLHAYLCFWNVYVKNNLAL